MCARGSAARSKPTPPPGEGEAEEADGPLSPASTPAGPRFVFNTERTGQELGGSRRRLSGRGHAHDSSSEDLLDAVAGKPLGGLEDRPSSLVEVREHAGHIGGVDKVD